MPLSEILLITPPFSQINTPYPATCYLKGFLNTRGISATQFDLSLEVFLRIFSKEGLTHVFDQVELTLNATNNVLIDVGGASGTKFADYALSEMPSGFIP
jgi:hypothetical protein